ncbi:MAG TPA: type IV toxin-antitoxin system AbiEi family antitoxin domain-containing protein [Acidimicrobiales bacterium]|nr:type IV toxin-antitoxin system AbiEi family antitoxin domain-containing protein [Acidimicrobiales bacterium]
MLSHAFESLTSVGLDDVASAQHGLVTFAQCVGAGMSADRIRRRVANGSMVQVRYGIYRWCGAAATWEMMANAAVLSADKGAVLSHHSAARLWDLSDRALDRLELTCPTKLRLQGVISHRHDLAAKEITARRNIPVTTPARTLLDLAETVPAPALGRIVDDALRRRLVTVSQLTDIQRAHTGVGRRRTTNFRTVLADRGAGYVPGANPGEQDMDRLWDQLGLPAAEKQYPVRIGRRTYVLDRAIPPLKIGVEWNGFKYHGLRTGFDHDHERRLDLISAGWLVLEFTMKSGPNRIARAVLQAIDERSHDARSPT